MNRHYPERRLNPPPERIVECENCYGDGKVECPRCEGHGGRRVTEQYDPLICPACDGEGTIPCVSCGGSGEIDLIVEREKLEAARADFKYDQRKDDEAMREIEKEEYEK